MIRSRLVAALAALPLAVATVAAGGDSCRTVGTGTDAYELCEVATYFHQAETKVSNLGNVDGSPHGIPSWDTNAPTASVSSGAGGGYASNSLLTQEASTDEATAVFEGTFEGVLESLDVDLHLLGESPITAQEYNVRLEVDGIAYAVADEFVIVSVEEENASAARRLDFAITGLTDVLGTQPGTYTLRLTVEPTYIVNDTAVFVFDTTEVPGGITFNSASIDPSIPVVEAY